MTLKESFITKVRAKILHSTIIRLYPLFHGYVKHPYFADVQICGQFKNSSVCYWDSSYCFCCIKEFSNMVKQRFPIIQIIYILMSLIKTLHFTSYSYINMYLLLLYTGICSISGELLMIFGKING